MHLVIALPAYNESATIGQVLDSIKDSFQGVSIVTKLVIDDGSTDTTKEIAISKGAMVVSHSHNKGVGAALQTAVKTALGIDADIMVNIDSDGQFDTSDIELIIQPILEDKADFVTASRFKDKSLKPEMPWIKYQGNRFMSALISKLTKSKYYDVSCGFRAYSKETLLRLNLFGSFTYTQESFLDLAFKGLRIIEVPVKVRGVREHGKSRVASNLFKYGSNTISIILHSVIDYRPLSVFGVFALILFLASIGFGLFFFIHYFVTGRFSPHIWAGFVSGFLFAMGLLVIVLSLLGDMLSRIRLNQEEILYNQKTERYK
ncbi:MAG: glycosyltransferase family 2 protein [Candidatus Cloacimonetes bacterium]|nr:glycosyltransferase family 2 protein [Candidatus Cloacimonadota bacterium]